MPYIMIGTSGGVDGVSSGERDSGGRRYRRDIRVISSS
jgi:hypothetical protein